MSYSLLVLFSVFRVILCFIVLFGWIGPKFLPHARKLQGIDKLIYTYVAIGGLILINVLVLANLHLYDFISLLACLLLFPFIYFIYEEVKSGVKLSSLGTVLENRILKQHVEVIELFSIKKKKSIRSRVQELPKLLMINNKYTATAVLIGIVAAIIRLVPVFKNSAPSSRGWYFELNAIKNIPLQNYFGDIPHPKGMHSLVQVFSTLTQVSPEMILKILGSLISFLLAMLIFWMIRDLTRGKTPVAALFGMSVYAIIPTLVLPVSLDIAGSNSSLSLAICFALPTAVLFLRNLRSIDKAPWFYVTIGIIATGLINLFVLLMILYPLLVIGLLFLPKRRYLKSLYNVSLYLFVVLLVTLSPFIFFLLLNGLEIIPFFELQLYSTSSFSYFPNLVLDLDILSLVYLGIAVVLLIGFIIQYFINKRKVIGDDIIFTSFFIGISFLFTPYFLTDSLIIDPDQLTIFYSLLISIMAGLMFHAVVQFATFIFRLKKGLSEVIQMILVVSVFSGVLVLTGGVNTDRSLPKTLPNGFFDAYYKIINERLAYSYATVGPEIDRTLSKNRHYFMNYDFFLGNYGEIDSLYQKYLTVPLELRGIESVPPASIFLFLEKAPYNSIQQGILYDAPSVMRDLEQWLAAFSDLENRNLSVYFEDEEAVIYEITNRENESKLSDVLLNIYPKKESRASTIFK
ncbi:MAG: hypothetical protein WC967_04140 [Balneolaceae bacterium]